MKTNNPDNEQRLIVTYFDNFPESLRASETALLFMQFIMRSLKYGGATPA